VAAQHGKFEIFPYLKGNGSEINISNTYNRTVLHYALDSGSLDIIRLLLEKVMSINLTNTSEVTLLHFSGQFVKHKVTNLVESDAAYKQHE